MVLGLVPYHHVFGLLVNMCVSLLQGCTVVNVPGGLDTTHLLRAMDQYHVSVAYVYVYMYLILCCCSNYVYSFFVHFLFSSTDNAVLNISQNSRDPSAYILDRLQKFSCDIQIIRTNAES